MSKKARDFIPPGLAYIADNIISRQNVLGVPRETGARWARDLGLPGAGQTVFFAGCGYQYSAGLGSMMSLVRKMDKSPVGAELPMGLARFQKKVGVDLAGVYRRLSVKGGDSDGQPLKDAAGI
jgi:hypothetical protein